MAKLDVEGSLQRLQNRYRLVIMNDDTYEEVVTFRLSRLSVYIAFSTVFVLLVGLTVALIVFTPLAVNVSWKKSTTKFSLNTPLASTAVLLGGSAGEQPGGVIWSSWPQPPVIVNVPPGAKMYSPTPP